MGSANYLSILELLKKGGKEFYAEYVMKGH
jgi:hypothetical protein